MIFDLMIFDLSSPPPFKATKNPPHYGGGAPSWGGEGLLGHTIYCDLTNDLGQDALEALLGLAAGLADWYLHLDDVVARGTLHMIVLALADGVDDRWEVDSSHGRRKVGTGVRMDVEHALDTGWHNDV